MSETPEYESTIHSAIFDEIERRRIWDDSGAYIQCALDVLGIPWNADAAKTVEAIRRALTREVMT